jgi:hypothetical protein
VVGALVTGLLAVLVGWAVGDLGTAIGVIVVVLLVQQIESNVPPADHHASGRVAAPGGLLTGVTAGAIVAGIIGAFLAVPVIAMLTAAGNELRLRHEARQAGILLGGAWATKEVSGVDAAVEGSPTRRRPRPLRRSRRPRPRRNREPLLNSTGPTHHNPMLGHHRRIDPNRHRTRVRHHRGSSLLHLGRPTLHCRPLTGPFTQGGPSSTLTTPSGPTPDTTHPSARDSH